MWQHSDGCVRCTELSCHVACVLFSMCLCICTPSAKRQSVDHVCQAFSICTSKDIALCTFCGCELQSMTLCRVTCVATQLACLRAAVMCSATAHRWSPAFTLNVSQLPSQEFIGYSCICTTEHVGSGAAATLLSICCKTCCCCPGAFTALCLLKQSARFKLQHWAYSYTCSSTGVEQSPISQFYCRSVLVLLADHYA